VSAVPVDPATRAAARPDGDVDLERDFRDFRVPDCPACGGILKPAVVFWARAAERITWTKPFRKVLEDTGGPLPRWFTGGEMNTVRCASIRSSAR
jgi:hypothetical protein